MVEKTVLSDTRDATEITRSYMDSILFEQRLIDSEEADLHMELFGKSFDSPIMMAAFSYLGPFSQGRDSAIIEYAKTTSKLNMVNWTGMMENDEFQEIIDSGSAPVRVIKPFADKAKIFDQIEYAIKAGALAVGMDIDHIFGTDGRYDIVAGEAMAKQTMADLKSYISATDLPFVVKGVLSVRDAVKAVECGAKGIVISHHHGRIPFAVPPIMVLPEIKKEIGDSGIKIFVDCAIDTGADAYKALAMGADAISVGRVTYPVLYNEGIEALEKYFVDMMQELAMIMGFTGCKKLSEIDASVLRFKPYL